MIEEIVTINACSEIIQREPWAFTTSDCCLNTYDDFFDNDEIWTAFEEYTIARGEHSPWDDDNGVNAVAYQAFKTTPAFDDLIDTWTVEHALSDECENTDIHLEFFQHIALKTPHEMAPAFLRSLVSRL